jgi:DNA-binding XRE family transcriptional regulator/quercetin dioxygenase-like cupin family protein
MGESLAEGSDGSATTDVSGRLREARKQAGLSLRELARRLDISASALSQIETGKSRPSVRTLYALVSELGLSMDDLFDNQSDTTGKASSNPTGGVGGNGGSAGVHVERGGALQAGPNGGPVQTAASRSKLELDTGVTWERLTSGHDPLVDFLFCTYEVGGASNAHANLVRHSGQEYGIVLKGELDVTVGFETYHLRAGDSVSFNSNEPHVLENKGTEPAEAIWFVIGRRGTDPRNPAFNVDGGGTAG